LLGFSRLLNWLLKRWHDTVLATLVGLLFGSLWRIWPYQQIRYEEVREKLRPVQATPHLPESFELSLWALFVVGIALVLAIEWYATRQRAAKAA